MARTVTRGEVAVAVLALVLAMACQASANDGDVCYFVCETSAASPDLQDALAVVFDMLRGGDMCNFNKYQLGSQCTTTNTVGGASIGLCGHYDDCIPNTTAATLYWDLILDCADNSFGGTKVGGQVKGMRLGDYDDEHSIRLILF